jgi:hypothetical protein
MPAPQRYGRRKVWDRAALDRALAGGEPNSSRRPDDDPIMAAIDAFDWSIMRRGES